jgi:hypothetical protein
VMVVAGCCAVVADCDGWNWLNMDGPLRVRCCAGGVARDASLYIQGHVAWCARTSLLILLACAAQVVVKTGEENLQKSGRKGVKTGGLCARGWTWWG